MTVQSFGARWVVPMDGLPIEFGEVIVEDGVIAEVRPSKLPSAERHDFGHSVLMPGFVNAHTHLEYSSLRGFLEDVPFFPWIRALNQYKGAFNAEDWLYSTKLGAAEAIRSGVTTVADNTDAGLTAQVASESGLRAKVYQEVFGIDHRDSTLSVLEILKSKLWTARTFESDRISLGISPHALYTVRPAVMECVRTFALENSLDLSIHVAESESETELIELGCGPFADMFARRGIEWQPPRTSPTQYARDLGILGPNTLAIHCVQQNDNDIEILRRSGAAVVHCPKSNAKLGAGIAPMSKWLGYPEIRIGIGTDSVVSNNSIDMFEEMRFALLNQRAINRSVPTVTAEQVLRMATLGGAEALGMADKTGSLTPGKRADLVCVSLQELHTWPYSDPYAAVVFSARPDNVAMTMTDGNILYDGTTLTTIAIAETILRTRESRERAASYVQSQTTGA